jgi:surfeit locus 1 family protein
MTSTLWDVARRPKWIAALLFALAVAAVFALLAQWQWERSNDNATVIERDTETPVALSSVASPQSIISSDASGRIVTVDCQILPGDDLWVTNRVLPEGRGDWLIRHCVTAEGYSLALAAGWASEAVDHTFPAIDAVVSVQGRYVPTESPQTSDFENGERRAISVAELINLWEQPGPVYGGYVVSDHAPEGLMTISTTPPSSERELNWLNIFYAAEWIIFAGFALYLWYRLMRDEWERESELTPRDAE